MRHFTLTLFVAGAFAIGALLLLIVNQQYHSNLTRIEAHSKSLVNEKPQLQFSLYTEHKEALSAHVKSLAKQPGVTNAAFYSTKGSMLSSAGPDSDSLPSLEQARANTPLSETAMVALMNGKPHDSRGFWQSITTGSPLYLSLPIITQTQPNRVGLIANDFISAQLNSNNPSRKVIGYALLRIGARDVLLLGKTAVLQVLALALLAAIVCGALVYTMARRISAPIADLNRVAEQISSGKPISELEVPQNKEFRSVASALNEIIRKARMHEQEAKFDRERLSRKVDESASKLLHQDDQLTRAKEEIIQAKNELRKVSFYDSLTGLPNRALFQEQLQKMLTADAQASNKLALLLVNLNDFSRVNDTFGYSAGDLVLKEVGQRLLKAVRHIDKGEPSAQDRQYGSVSRIGGDEFALIIDTTESEPATVVAVAQRVIRSVTAPFQVLGQEIVVTPSIGIALAPQDAQDGEGLSRAASAAKNSIAQTPKGAYSFYSDQLAQSDLNHFKLESQLRKAIGANELKLLYQPQIDTADGSIVCAEALLRWNHPEQGEMSPGQFLPLARKIGIIGDLGRWTLLQACGQLKALRGNGHELPRVAINITPDELGSRLVVHVCEALEVTGISPDSLELGLSEIVLEDDNSEAMRCLREISDLGVHISLDNFGISATPLHHLSLCPLNEMKIDRQIVRNCNRDDRNASLVRAVISIAQGLDLRIVAEGVETEAEFNFLVNAGARMLQGFLFSQPISGEELQRKLSEPWPYMSQLQNFKLSRP